MTPYSFRAGFVENRAKVRVLAQTDQLVALGSTKTKVFMWEAGRWLHWPIPWVATRPWVTAAGQLFILGPQGSVFESSKAMGGGISEEAIDPTGQGAERSGDFLNLRAIGEHLYACGMSRQVYRREGVNQWMRADQGVVQPPGTTEVAGFYSIHGLDESDFYAVGLGGEVWRCLHGNWTQTDRVTNVPLHCIRAIAPDRIYASGQSGVLLRGAGNRWAVLDTSAVAEQSLWSIQPFKGEIYLASEKALYKLDENDVPRKIDTGLAEDCSYRHLHANDGVMWSFGGKNVAWTDDGKTWTDVTP